MLSLTYEDENCYACFYVSKQYTSCVAKRFDLAMPSGDAPWICTDHSMIIQLFDKVAWIQKHIET